MKILMATSEAVPFAKTGGLADVCGSLPVELEKLGHQPTLILPAYRQMRSSGMPIEPTGIRFEVPIGSKTVTGTLLKSQLPSSNVPVYLVQQEQYFDRPDLYRENGQDYRDNCERFVFFCRAVMEAIRLLDLHVDVLHANDWQTALIPAYLKIEYRGVPGYEQIGTLFTIHNMAYQGVFWHWDMLLTGLDWKYFNWQQMEFFGNLNLLKTGPDLCRPAQHGQPALCRGNPVGPLGLRARRRAAESPRRAVGHRQRRRLPRVESGDRWQSGGQLRRSDTFAAGKAACKAALETRLRLPGSPDVPLIGLRRPADRSEGDRSAGRHVIRDWVQSHDARWVILGTGEPKFEEQFAMLAERFPQKVATRLEFSNPLAHRIEAGADIFAHAQPLRAVRTESTVQSQIRRPCRSCAPRAGWSTRSPTSTKKRWQRAPPPASSFSEYSPLALNETLSIGR